MDGAVQTVLQKHHLESLLVVDVAVTNARKWLSSWALVTEDRIEREGAEPGEDRQQVELFLPHLGPGETEWRIVDEIEYVETVGLKPGGELFGEFLGGEVPGHGRLW